MKDPCGQGLGFGIAAGCYARNPAAGLREALRPMTRAALELSAPLLPSPGELGHIERSWLDLDGATLMVPAEVVKRKKADKANGLPQLASLAPQTVRMLFELQPLTGHGRHVLPSMLTGERCLSENMVRGALRRMASNPPGSIGGRWSWRRSGCGGRCRSGRCAWRENAERTAKSSWRRFFSRLHSWLGYVSPMQFESAWLAAQQRQAA